MIKERNILVKINCRNVTHFKNLGYEIQNGVKRVYEVGPTDLEHMT